MTGDSPSDRKSPSPLQVQSIPTRLERANAELCQHHQAVHISLTPVIIDAHVIKPPAFRLHIATSLLGASIICMFDPLGIEAIVEADTTPVFKKLGTTVKI
jgi:hypothetical protein